MERPWSNQLTTELINCYRSFPCLWKTSDKVYLNRNKKREAYEKLVDICKPLFPEITREMVVKKIQSLRGSFRKEYKKVKNSKRSGASADAVHVPTLWYYDLLLFTADSEIVSDSLSNTGPEDGEIENTEDTDTETVPPEEVELSGEIAENTGTKDADSNRQQVTDAVAGTSVASEQSLYQQRKQKKRALEETQREFMQTCTKALASTQDLNETEALGIIVSKKLKRMNSLQALYAEDLINAVLRKGLMGQLTDTTVVCERQRSVASHSNESDAHEYPIPPTIPAQQPTQFFSGLPSPSVEFPSYTSL